MTDERPLNVRVAEALGCKPILRGLIPVEWQCPCDALMPPHARSVYDRRILPYGDDSPEGWACTGPLIQRLEIQLAPPAPEAHQYTAEMCGWVARHGEQDDGTWAVGKFGVHPPEAACNAILALAEAGRLPK